MRSAVRRAPWTLIITLALVPAVVTLLEMSTELGFQTLVQLIREPDGLVESNQNPWLAMFRPLGTSTFLLILFGWLATTLPVNQVFRHQSLQLKRWLVAVLTFLSAFSLWAGIILGDLAWRVAFQPLSGEGAPSALQTSPWVYGLAVLVTASALYLLIRPAGRQK